jgi:hypothetical protein
MDSSKKRAVCAQLRRFRARFVQGHEAALYTLFSARCLGQWVSEECGQWRERLYGPLRTVMLFIEQVLSADHSCQDVVALGVSARVGAGRAPNSLSSGPYCRARQRLSLGLIERLGRAVGQRVCEGQPGGWLWRGRQVKLIDGSTVSMPDTDDNRSNFPQHREQKPGLGFPVARVVGLVSLSCGVVLDWASGPCEGKGSGETGLAWGLVSGLGRGDIVIADRAYAGYFMIARLLQAGVDVVIRQHHRRRCDFRRGKRLGARDHVVVWTRPKRPAWMDELTYAGMPEQLSMREARVGAWTLASSLLDARAVSKQDLLGLYRSRWQIELDLRSIKAVMQMDILRCKSAQMVCKEIATHLLAYNLVRAVMAQAASRTTVLPRQLSFKAAMQLLRAFEQNLRHCPRQRLARQHAHLLGAIARLRLPHRPDRVEPRCVKRRTHTHPLLTKPRSVERQRLAQRKATIMANSLR